MPKSKMKRSIASVVTPGRHDRVELVEAAAASSAGPAHAGEVVGAVKLDLAVILERRQGRIEIVDHDLSSKGDMASSNFSDRI